MQADPPILRARGAQETKRPPVTLLVALVATPTCKDNLKACAVQRSSTGGRPKTSNTGSHEMPITRPDKPS